MSEPNFAGRAGEFAIDAAIDTAANSIANKAIDIAASHIPAGEAVKQMLKTEVDLAIDNAINAELHKGVGGIVEDVEGMLFGKQEHQHHHQQEHHHQHHHHHRQE